MKTHPKLQMFFTLTFAQTLLHFPHTHISSRTWTYLAPVDQSARLQEMEVEKVANWSSLPLHTHRKRKTRMRNGYNKYEEKLQQIHTATLSSDVKSELQVFFSANALCLISSFQYSTDELFLQIKSSTVKALFIF